MAKEQVEQHAGYTHKGKLPNLFTVFAANSCFASAHANGERGTIHKGFEFMAQSFSLKHDTFRQGDTLTSRREPRQVLITGAAGRIGSYFAIHHDPARYELRLLVRDSDPQEKVDAIRAFGEVVTGDIGDLDGLKKYMDGMHTVLHLAADASPHATWDSLLPTNINGTYNVCAAAKAAGVQKIIYASSIHAVSGYDRHAQVKTSEPVNPGDMYGVSKCFGEALCRYMAEQEGVDAIAIRIGAFQPLEAAQHGGWLGMIDAFVSHRDLHQLVEKCIDADHLRFAVFHGLSANTFNRLDISDARELVGYEPQDDFTQLNPSLSPLNLSQTVSNHSLADRGAKSGLRNEAPNAKRD